MTQTQEAVRAAFVELTDVLVADIDIDVYLRRLIVRAAKLLGVPAVALVQADDDGTLDVTAGSGELATLLARYEVALAEGPAVDAMRLGAPVQALELTAATLRWPQFAPKALEAGVTAALALPCRRRDEVLGALTMYAPHTDALSGADTDLGRAMANAVSIGVTAYREHLLETRAGQLQEALHSRVIIEQAKGVLAERGNVSVAEAFELMRRHARNNNVNLHAVAQAVVSGSLTPPAGPHETG